MDVFLSSECIIVVIDVKETAVTVLKEIYFWKTDVFTFNTTKHCFSFLSREINHLLSALPTLVWLLFEMRKWAKLAAFFFVFVFNSAIKCGLIRVHDWYNIITITSVLMCMMRMMCILLSSSAAIKSAVIIAWTKGVVFHHMLHPVWLGPCLDDSSGCECVVRLW